MNKDSLVNNEKNARIRPVVLVFIVFEMVMLIQTSFSNIGTILSGVLCGLIVVTYLFESCRIKVCTGNNTLILYVLLVFFSTIIADGFNHSIFLLLTYTIMYILLSSLTLSRKEAKWVINGYVLTGLIYSVFIIVYRLTRPTYNIHSSFIILGSRLDPNYIGLPIIVAFSIVFYDILNKRREFFKVIAVVVMAIAIILTSSRGNFLCMSVCVLGNIVVFLSRSRTAWYNKILIVIGVLALIIMIYMFSSKTYGSFLQRIISFSNTDISNGRFEVWDRAIDVWWDRPILGGGLESLGRVTSEGVHNTFIQLLCDSGIVGFALFISFLASLIKKSYQYNQCLFLCLIGVFCHSFFLGAITTRCFWVTLIMISMVLSNMGKANANDANP